MLKVYMKDIRAAGMCSRGLRLFAKKYDLDVNDFLENGIDIDLLPQNNVHVIKLRKILEGREQNG